MSTRVKKLLKTFKSELNRIYGNQLKAIYLYGSYARGEAQPDSDFDLDMVLRGEFDYLEMLKRSDDFAASFCLEHDVVVSRAFVTEKEYKEKQIPFLINVRRDGVMV